MGYGAITQYVDVAQLVLYAFWAFFFGLIYYLVREGHREGYPLDTEGRARGTTGFPIPGPKTFKIADNHFVTVPSDKPSPQLLNAEPRHGWIGAPLVPTGNALLAGVGPGAYADRADVVELDAHGHVKIVPLRVATGFDVSRKDRDPRGMPVIGADGEVGGVVRDLWLDRMELMFRYIEVEVPGSARTVLLPMNFGRVGRRGVKVEAVYAAQIAQTPVTANPEQVTLLEEEKITAFYGAGTLYADIRRAEPIL